MNLFIHTIWYPATHVYKRRHTTFELMTTTVISSFYIHFKMLWLSSGNVFIDLNQFVARVPRVYSMRKRLSDWQLRQEFLSNRWGTWGHIMLKSRWHGHSIRRYHMPLWSGYYATEDTEVTTEDMAPLSHTYIEYFLNNISSVYFASLLKRFSGKKNII